MATLSTEDRQRIWRGLMRYWSVQRDPLPDISKSDLLAAVNATDAWIDDNSASYVAALPSAFANNSTSTQKIILFCVVAAMRVSSSFARCLVGEVD